MVNLYYSYIPESIDEGLINSLSEYRQIGLKNKKQSLTRTQAIASELLLEKAASQYYKRPLPITQNIHGKPYFEDNKLHFNISHSGDMVACATAFSEIGLDVQEIKPYNLKFAQRFYCDEEIEDINQAEDKNIAFTEIWCKKESYLKAKGLGLRIELNSFSVLSPEMHFRFGRIDTYCYCICLPDYMISELNIEEIKLL